MEIQMHLLNEYQFKFAAERGLNTDNRTVEEGEKDRVTMSASRTSIRSKKTGKPTPDITTYGGIKLGWIQGVLIPCLLNIWGVMLFLRISWIVGQAGIGLSIAIICLSATVCVITTLSLSAICTNGELQGGGVYYIVSRSLGAELGASVGIIFAFANAVAASMNTIGFCDSLNDLLKSQGLSIIDNAINDVRIVGSAALFVMCLICAFGMDWETKTQNFLIVVIVLAIFNYLIGAMIGPQDDAKVAQGFIGLNFIFIMFSVITAAENWGPDFRQVEGVPQNFFTVFAMYFPAVTGVQAGANICGDLRNPAQAIPKGTLLALFISCMSYLMISVMCGIGVVRDASGDLEHYSTGNLASCKPNCQYGLHNDYEVTQLMALWGPLIYAGCWAATLSTALTNLLSVPRLIQALGVDRIYPGLIYFSKPYGKHGEPYRGYVLTLFVSLAFLLIGDLNTIAPLITNFYLASYALINFCTFHAGFIHHISWRPTFKYYSTWLSLAGSILCLVIMMIISWITSFITLIIFGILYLVVLYKKPEANWGSSTEAQKYKDNITKLLQLFYAQSVDINLYNPQLLVLSGHPCQRPYLLEVGQLITTDTSFMIAANLMENQVSSKVKSDLHIMAEGWLHEHKFRCFYVLVDGFSKENAVKALIQCSGLGSLSPNILLMGFKNNWVKKSHVTIKKYVVYLRTAFELNISVSVLRVPDRFGPAKHLDFVSEESSNLESGPSRSQTKIKVMATDSDVDMHVPSKNDDMNKEGLSQSQQSTDDPLKKLDKETDSLSNLDVQSTSRYCHARHKSISYAITDIDVWWLYDDGGLNILLPYIIARRRNEKKLPLRIFALARKGQESEEARESLVEGLKKYRIDYSALVMLRGVDEAPSAVTWQFFNDIIEGFKTDSESDVLISEDELVRQHFKTNRHLRIRELMLRFSSSTAFIVMTLPLPRKDVSAALYMSWLEVLSRGLPSVLFVRGNGKSVLK